MKNIFSLTTHEILSFPDEWLPRHRKEEDQLGELIYRYIPLEGDTLWGFRKFKQELVNKINDRKAAFDVKLLADLTIELCKPYLKYEVPACNNSIVQSFQYHLYNQEYEDDLKTFMILSYAYSQSKKRIIKKKEIHELLRMRNAESPSKPRPVYDHLFKIYNNSKNFNTVFLGSFLNYHAETIVVNSWYDCEVIYGLTSSAIKRKNPFVYSEKYRQTDMELFIKSFTDITLNKHSKTNVLSCINEADVKSAKITNNKIYIFNHFMLERLGNFNLINSLYHLQQKLPSLSLRNFTSLYQLANSPLLKFRIRFLDYFEDQFEKYFKHDRLDFPEWNLFLEQNLLHQMTCTLPVLDLVFHYLAYLATNECSFSALFESSIDRYFDELTTNESFVFFEYSDPVRGSFIPSPIHQFPSKAHNQNYSDLCDIVYEYLIGKSFYLSENERLLRKLSSIYIGQQKLLKQKLVPLHTDLNIERD